MRPVSVTALFSFLLLGTTTVLADGTNGDCTYDCEYDHPYNPDDGCTGKEQGLDVEKCLCKPLMESKEFMDCAAKCDEDDREYYAQGFSPWCSEHMFDGSDPSTDDDAKTTSATDKPTATASSSDETTSATESAAAETSTGAAAIGYGKSGLAIAGGLLAAVIA